MLHYPDFKVCSLLMDIPGEKFDKSEILCSTKVISALFENGNLFYTPLFKVVWDFNPESGPAPAQVMFSVPKRGFRHAVTRNLIKRRLRESYRRNKQFLYEYLSSENIQLVLVIIIKGNTVPDYKSVEKSVSEFINKLIVQIGEKQSQRKKAELLQQKSRIN
jgi:ribonuclease P protein component